VASFLRLIKQVLIEKIAKVPAEASLTSEGGPVL